MVLHVHSEHSNLDGRSRTVEIAEQAKATGFDYVALTDHDEVGGHLDFQQACEQTGIKPIFATEARWLRNIAASREAKTRGFDGSHIILLAADEVGLRNLWSLSSLAYEERYFYNKPQLEPDLMRQYSSGLFASDGCGLTRFADFVENGDEDSARQEWAVLLDIFGDRFYSELHTFQVIDPQTPDEIALNARITAMNQAKLRFAKEMGVPLVVVNDAHYARERQWPEHRLIWKMSTQSYKKDQAGGELGHAADWMMDRDEMVHFMNLHGVSASVVEEAIKNGAQIAEQCNVEIKPTLAMPRLHKTDEEDAQAFRRGIEEGFKRFVVDKGLPEEHYRQRLEREASLIVDQGMPGYFNVVADYVMAARSGTYRQWVTPGSKPTPCLCGPGRGSGGGSLVNYVLGITSIDPIKYDLMFERFINPDRPDYPDIDVDFQKSHRLGIKDYLGKRYGDANITAIGTRSRSGPKATLKDLWRAMYGNKNYADMLKILKLVGKVDMTDFEPDEDADPDEEVPTWDEVLMEMGGELAPWARDYPVLFERMGQMVGLARQTGVHAAGVVINTAPILGNIPTRVKKGVRATQFDMHEVAAMGGVKDDLLSNKGLDVLAIARDLVWARHGVWLDYDGFGFGVPEGCQDVVTFGDEQYNDPAIWDQVHRGETAGLFQIHTPSATKQAIRFKPTSLVDLADLASINRPGVLRVPGLLDSYIRRRHGQEEISYDHPLLEPITGPSSTMNTYGILVYQEQLIRVARELAGFTAGEAEGLRKAIGKKLMDKMVATEPAFISGCLNNPLFTGDGGTEKVARKIWQSLLASGAYAFNKSHAIGYATQPTQEIWVKYYYFDEFITACLAIHTDKTNRFISECRRRNRPILPPDVNHSGERFTLTADGIRFGLADILMVGDNAIPEILARRPFDSMDDFLMRTSKSKGHKKGIIDNLVKVGAFDFTGVARDDLLDQVYYHRALGEVAPKKRAALAPEEAAAIVAEKWHKKPEDYPRFDFGDEKTLLDIEKELVGTFITVDPMHRYAPMIEAECIRHPMDIDDYKPKQAFVIGGEVARLSTHMQKNKRLMCFITVRWAEEDFEFMAFADAWDRYKRVLEVGAPVACEVVKLDNDGCHLKTVERLDWI